MKRLILLLSLISVLVAASAWAQETSQPATDAPAANASEPAQVTDEKAGEDVVTSESEYEAEKKKRRTVPFAVMVGVYYPTDSKVRSVFGDDWVRFGLRPLPMANPRVWRPTFDVSYYVMSRKVGTLENEVKLLPISVGLIRGFGTDEKVRGYAAGNAGICYCSVDAPTAGVSKDGIAFNANATLGLMLGKRLCLEGRYEFMNEFAGFDFSAFTVSAAYKVFSIKF